MFEICTSIIDNYYVMLCCKVFSLKYNSPNEKFEIQLLYCIVLGQMSIVITKSNAEYPIKTI